MTAQTLQAVVTPFYTRRFGILAGLPELSGHHPVSILPASYSRYMRPAPTAVASPVNALTHSQTLTLHSFAL